MAWLSFFYGRLYFRFNRESRVPNAGFDTEGTRCILAQSDLALLRRVIVVVRSRVESSSHRFWYQRNPSHSGPKRFGSLTFYDRLYYGFNGESRVRHTGFNTEGTWHILDHSGLTLLLPMESQEQARTKADQEKKRWIHESDEEKRRVCSRWHRINPFSLDRSAYFFIRQFRLLSVDTEEFVLVSAIHDLSGH